MPIWIVKNIFSFLDAKTLHTCKKVSKYWSYVVTEMIKEEKARRQLNTQLQAIQKAVGKRKIEEIKNRIADNIPNSPKKKNEIRYYSLGAIATGLVPDSGRYLKETSLVEKAIKEMPDDYGETIALTTFPRLLKSDMEMYRYKSCFLKDVNLQHEVDENIKKQQSLLTYSLESLIDSFKITVEESVLEDW
nr:unnamed protein product [Callosobruchus analis]